LREPVANSFFKRYDFYMTCITGLFRILIFLTTVFSLGAPVYAGDIQGDLLRNAESLFRAKKSEEAEQLISKFINNNNNAQAYVQTGNLFARLKRWDDSVHYLEIAVNRKVSDALAWYELGIAQHQSKKIDSAVASMRKSISISSTTQKSVIALGEILELARDRYDAREVYQMGIKKLGDRADLEAKLCWLNFQDTFFKESLITCSKAVKLNPKDFVSATLFAKTLYDSQRQDEAFKMFKGITDKFPRAALAYRARGLIYFQEKGFEQAVSDLGKAFALDAYDDEAGIHLARALFELKHYAQALPIFIEACRLNSVYRFEFITKQRELARKNLSVLASSYQAALDHI
jgi:predicted Zn-dependent protease